MWLRVGLPLIAVSCFGQTDPGVQGGNRGTGATIINPANDPKGFTAFFDAGKDAFQEVEVVTGDGLGPRFNSNSCVSCHIQPAIGGSGARVNPQFTIAGSSVAPRDTTPPFITANGPTREARFPFFFNANGTANLNNPNGGVEDLFTISGSAGAGACNIAQPSFQAAINANNIIFRIPTPTFGAGLIENLDDSTLLANRLALLNNNLGISGTFNRNGNDGTITRFGWKAQNKSLHIFAGEAYSVEMGISNLLFTQDRPLPGEDQNGAGLPANCLNRSGGGYPEDISHPAGTPASEVLDDVSAFANFMRFLAPPPTGGVVLNGQPVPAATIAQGASVFSSIGCATCHDPTIGPTQPSNFAPALSNITVRAFSDIELHHMGTGLNDNVSQGAAGGDEFRTAPLWGLGQRIFLLHDGRTTSLITAIAAHASNGSEANTVVSNFNNLSVANKQALLDFLRSL